MSARRDLGEQKCDPTETDSMLDFSVKMPPTYIGSQYQSLGHSRPFGIRRIESQESTASSSILSSPDNIGDAPSLALPPRLSSSSYRRSESSELIATVDHIHAINVQRMATSPHPGREIPSSPRAASTSTNASPSRKQNASVSYQHESEHEESSEMSSGGAHDDDEHAASNSQEKLGDTLNFF